MKVCLVGLKCFDHLAGEAIPRYLGGIETQLAVLARGLAHAGCDVSMITYDHGQDDQVRFGDVTVWKSHRPDAGLPLARTIHPRSTLLWRAMRRADADVYLQMGAGIETGQVALGCRLLGGNRRFLFCLASDANYGAHLHAGRFGLDGKAYQFGLNRADLIVAQTKSQQDGLQQAVALPSEVVPMAVVAPPVAATQSPGANGTPESPRRPCILWIGRITKGKRLEWLLEMARACPEADFEVVGTPNGPSPYATDLLESAATIPNVTVHGRVSAEQLAALYARGTILCCTSELEGFPTTFLEAWCRGIPVLTTFDPDGVVATHALGRVVESVPALTDQLRKLTANETARTTLAANARRYYTENHTVEAVSRRFVEIFQKIHGQN